MDWKAYIAKNFYSNISNEINGCIRASASISAFSPLFAHYSHIHNLHFTDHLTGSGEDWLCPAYWSWEISLSNEPLKENFGTVFTSPFPVCFGQHLLSAPPDHSSVILIVRLRATWSHLSALPCSLLRFPSSLPNVSAKYLLCHRWWICYNLCTLWSLTYHQISVTIVMEVPIQIPIFSMSSLSCGVDNWISGVCVLHTLFWYSIMNVKYLPDVAIRWRLIVDTYSPVSPLGPFSRETAVQGLGLQEHSTVLQHLLFEAFFSCGL